MITTPTVSGKPGQAPTGLSCDLYPLIGSHSTWTDPRGPVSWRGRALVGEDGATASWLRAQHAHAQPAFQRRYLRLLADAVRADNAQVPPGISIRHEHHPCISRYRARASGDSVAHMNCYVASAGVLGVEMTGRFDD
jgi:hypothetical protein